MALFRRKKKEDVLPEEVRDYYRGEQRNRMGMAWLLAVGGFILTVAIVFALFFAGRWAYQAIFTPDENNTTEVTPGDRDFDEDESPFVDGDNDNGDDSDGNNSNGNSNSNGNDSTTGNGGQGNSANDEELLRTGPSN